MERGSNLKSISWQTQHGYFQLIGDNLSVWTVWYAIKDDPNNEFITIIDCRTGDELDPTTGSRLGILAVEKARKEWNEKVDNGIDPKKT